MGVGKERTGSLFYSFPAGFLAGGRHAAQGAQTSPEPEGRTMTAQLELRPRRKKIQKRPSLNLSGLDWVAPSPDWAQPVLGLPAPDPSDRQNRSALYSLTLHLAVLLGLLGAAWLAPPEIIERIIPVALVRPPEPIERPGTNAEPAPSAPKAVGARRSANAAALAASQPITPDQAAALRQAALEAARQAAQTLSVKSVQKTTLPTEIKRREVSANRVPIQAAAVVVPTAALDVSQIQPVAIDPARLQALAPLIEAPQQIDAPSLPEMSATEALAVLENISPSEYSGGVGAVAWDPGSSVTGSGTALNTGTGGAIGSEGGGPGGQGGLGLSPGSGGTGQAMGSVRCLESAHVQRYLQMVQTRTQHRWTIPTGVNPKARVILGFGLDAAGMASGIETVDVGDPALGLSAMQALQTASPFPPMIDANRCLSEKRILLTFTVPQT